MFEPREHQIEGAKRGYSILKDKGLVFNHSQERVGKSLMTILTVEMSSRDECLILTRKAAIPGWLDTIANTPTTKNYTVINYESIHKLSITPTIVILDESHNGLGTYPKPSKTFLKVAKVVYGLPLIYLSATPFAESLSQLYHQLRLSPWSPFAEYKNFYRWHEEFGIPETQYLAGRAIKVYKLTQEERILDRFESISFGYTRAEIGFEHEAVDKLHYITLDESTSDLITQISKDRVAEVQGYEVLAETVMSMLTKCYQIIGGTLKIDVGMVTETQKDYVSLQLGNTEKIDYILKTFGDSDDTVIMYHFKEEQKLLNHHFKNALILQGTTYAEGISLKHKNHLIIYSQDFRTSKAIQRRNRQADMNRKEPIIVHYILTEDNIDFMVYDAVTTKKENFNGQLYREEYQNGS